MCKEISDDSKRNPVLNSPEDITDDLIEKIISNDLDSLTINYEFTRSQFEGESDIDWKHEQYRTNPFWQANPYRLFRIEFEIVLGDNVHSLAWRGTDYCDFPGDLQSR